MPCCVGAASSDSVTVPKCLMQVRGLGAQPSLDLWAACVPLGREDVPRPLPSCLSLPSAAPLRWSGQGRVFIGCVCSMFSPSFSWKGQK